MKHDKKHDKTKGFGFEGNVFILGHNKRLFFEGDNDCIFLVFLSTHARKHETTSTISDSFEWIRQVSDLAFVVVVGKL